MSLTLTFVFLVGSDLVKKLYFNEKWSEIEKKGISGGFSGQQIKPCAIKNFRVNFPNLSKISALRCSNSDNPTLVEVI